MSAITLDALRCYAIGRTLFAPTTLRRAIDRLGFVQADPIRAPARAQDLTLRHRVRDYRAGDLERRYPKLDIEEDFFVNYGFLPKAHHALMHPRSPRHVWAPDMRARADAVLSFIRDRGAVHPREVDAHFAHGKVKNWFGGSSNASTQLLDGMHYRGLIRVARRDGGTRVYAAADRASATQNDETHRDPAVMATRMDALVDLALCKYAPVPGATLGQLLSLLRGGVPQWEGQRASALQRARERLAHARVDGVDWYWPAAERPTAVKWRDAQGSDTDGADRVRLLTPFDPLVWDRRRFEHFWGWAYRFEAYTPAPKRKLGYYALPLLWRGNVIGWANASAQEGPLHVEPGYVSGKPPRDRAFRLALDDEIERMRVFLGQRAET